MAKKAMKSKDALAKTAAKKRASTSSKVVSKQNVPYARSKKEPKKQVDIRNEIYAKQPQKAVAVEDTSKQTLNSRFLNNNNGSITAIFSNTPFQNQNEKLVETANQIAVARPSFQVQFNKLEKQPDVFELSSNNAKIKFQFDDKTPNKKKPAHRPLSLKDSKSVFWKNVDNKTNITFDVNSDRIVQNITINKKSEKYDYSIILGTENLKSVLFNEQKTLQLANEDINVFNISAPILKDSQNKTFTAQSFDVKEIGKNQIEVSFGFDAEAVNKEVRFPVTIAPQIINEDISVLKYQHFSKVTEKTAWKAGLYSSSAKFFKDGTEEKNILTIDKGIFSSIQGKKISGVYVKIQSDSVKQFKIENQIIALPSSGFGYLDITKNYFDTKGDAITLELIPQIGNNRDPSSWSEIHELPDSVLAAHAEHDLYEFVHGNHHDWDVLIPAPIQPYPGDVIVEYFIDDEMMPASETYALAGGVEANVALDSGELIASFNDIALIKTSLPFKISHTFKTSGNDFGCGKCWRLNLHQTLTKTNSKNNGCDYIYTDGSGYKHGFTESYYYFNESGEKTTIHKKDVKVDAPTGVMYTEISEKKYEVFKDQKTTSGLTLTTRLEGFKNIEYYEQRQKEEKQLEDTLFSYKKKLSEYVIADVKTSKEKYLEDSDYEINKTTFTIPYKLKESFINGSLPEKNFETFINKTSTGFLLQKQEAMQLESLYAQKQIYERQNIQNDIQKKLYREDSINTTTNSLNYQKDSIKVQKESIFASLRSIKESLKSDTDKTVNGYLWHQLDYLHSQAMLLGLEEINNEEDINNKIKDEFSHFYTTQNKPITIIEKTEDTTNNCPFKYSNNKFSITNLDLIKKQEENNANQKNDLTKQITLIDETIKTTNEQLEQIKKQIDFITNRNKDRIDELKKIYKDYINCEYEFIKLQQTMAVASLSDGTQSLCFNKYGKLCAITDSFNNYVVIEYDINNRISNINDGKKSIVFKYNPYGLLTSITDYNGNRVEYNYSDSNTDAKLQSVSQSNGDKIIFSYTSIDNIEYISSELEKTKTKLTYTLSNDKIAFTQLESIVNYSLVNKISDTTIESTTEAKALKNNIFSTIDFKYGTHECTITSDGKFKRYFMDDHGCLIGGYAQKEDGTLGGYSYAYVDRDNKESFSIHEIDDAVFTSESKSEYTIQGKDLPNTHKEFMFSALISYGRNRIYAGTTTSEPTGIINAPAQEDSELLTNLISMQAENNAEELKFVSIHEVSDNHFVGSVSHNYFSPPEKIQTNLESMGLTAITSLKKFMGLRAVVTYSDKTKKTFEQPAIQRTSGIQLCALPISLDLTKKVSQIKISFENSTKQIYSCTMMRLAPAECKNEKFDDFKKVISTKYSTDFVYHIDKRDEFHYRTADVNYKYNEQHLLLEKKTICTDSLKSNISTSPIISNTTTTLVTKYAYNDKGLQIREETYIEGEENTRGIAIDENIFDDKGRVIKNKVYNSLESSNIKYNEKEYHENDNSIQCEYDALGEHKISYEYDSATNNISTKILPSGSKFTYTRDCHTNAITGISQSTEDGESNSIETHYNCGLITKHTSRTNTIEYEYNAKREKTAVYFNGIKKVDYKYEKNIKVDDIVTEKTTVTLLGNSGKDSRKTEAYVDSKKNLIQTTLNSDILFRNTYSKTNDLISSTDYLTGEITTTDYDEQNHKVNSITRSAKDTNEGYDYLRSVKETYTYDSFGTVTNHSIAIGYIEVQGKLQRKPEYLHNYIFTYNSDNARSLKSIELPNSLLFEPQKDYLGRDCGKTLSDANGNKLFGEYVHFRKVGDHTSDMVSSISYGEVRNGKYSISEGIRYKYDVSGNITEKWENGKFAAAYSYDHLNRLIREDNIFFKKTWLYSYDGNGNRTTRVEMPFTRQKTNEIADYSNANIDNYSYNGDELVSCNSNVFSYDGFGNPTTYKNKVLDWDKGNRLVKFDNLEFDYDGFGKRIRKGSTYFTYDTSKNLVLMNKDGNCLEFIYDDHGLLGIKYLEEQYILRKNAQGDITHIFNLNGNLVARYEYDAWGNHIVLDETGNEITNTSHIGKMNPFRYRGYFYDEETNLYYLINRYYDPETGRFISQDQISYLQPEVINGLNLFAYCGNNPVMRIDENGCSWSSFWSGVKSFFKKVWSGIKRVGLFIAGVVLAAVGYVTAAFAFVFSIGCIIPLISSVIGPITGCFFQIGASICTYGGMLMAAACDDEYYNDMEAINWNPFNSDAQKVLDSKHISFYKGMPVIRTDAERSFNFGSIFLKRNVKEEDANGNTTYRKLDNVDEVKHEWGHHFQQAILGPVNYLWSVGIPSAAKFGVVETIDANGNFYSNYHTRPWENLADQIGGANGYSYNSSGNAKHLIMCSLLGGFSLIGSAVW